jgi:hypothetical protein
MAMHASRVCVDGHLCLRQFLCAPLREIRASSLVSRKVSTEVIFNQSLRVPLSLLHSAASR